MLSDFKYFFDDVGNPLGSKVKILEIGNFSYMISNISPFENSSLKNIFPFLIVKTKHLKEH